MNLMGYTNKQLKMFIARYCKMLCMMYSENKIINKLKPTINSIMCDYIRTV